MTGQRIKQTRGLEVGDVWSPFTPIRARVANVNLSVARCGADPFWQNRRGAENRGALLRLVSEAFEAGGAADSRYAKWGRQPSAGVGRARCAAAACR
jgi:hypothetical protein